MAGGEFDLIRKHFTRMAPSGILGVGDDCALLPTAPGAMAISTDLLLEGRHFFPNVDPEALGHKALAVNLSDLAAMGAQPSAFVLGLALPSIDDAWLAAFARGMYALADAHACPLIGGDTTRSVSGVMISITVFGTVAPELALRRSGARVGDDVWLSGYTGDADLALRLLSNQFDPGIPAERRQELLMATRSALEWPQPRVALGLALRGLATAAIDVSDGLLQDLGHILAASRCGAQVRVDEIPRSVSVASLSPDLARHCILSGGDVYELCFTAPPSVRQQVLAAGVQSGAPLSCIGSIVSEPGLSIVDRAGLPLGELPRAGYDHFA